jgi:two-component system nitrate/nitrite response regulator NarL
MNRFFDFDLVFSFFAFAGGLRIMSSRIVPTTIIGPKGLLRDSLVSLLGGYSYRVTDSCHTAADMLVPSEEESPRMVLLTARTVDITVAECANVRRTCRNCKIVAVLENLLDEDFEKLAHSAIDGCIPLDVSQDVLTKTLDLVMSGAGRIIVLADEPCLSISLSGKGQQKADSGIGPDSGGPSRQNLSDTDTAKVTNHDGPSPVPDVKPGSYHVDGIEREQPVATARCGDLPTTATIPALSERERQIIDGLIKGDSNKTIARAFGIAEATVKVHMKAILRKVSCSNRTQVAIWALGHTDVFRAPWMNGVSMAPSLAK